jgi:hypothetical protein
MVNDYANRYDLIQRLNRSVALSETRKSNPFTLIATLAIGVTLGMLLLSTLRSCEPEPVMAKTVVQQPPNHAEMTEYFKKAGSPVPEKMAAAVMATKSPRLMAAVATVESGGNPALRNTGYKRRHHGAWQVNPKYWGKVPRDAAGQAKQSERILAELTEDMPIKTALSRYGGDSTDKYARTVLAELTRVP